MLTPDLILLWCCLPLPSLLAAAAVAAAVAAAWFCPQVLPYNAYRDAAVRQLGNKVAPDVLAAANESHCELQRLLSALKHLRACIYKRLNEVSMSVQSRGPQARQARRATCFVAQLAEFRNFERTVGMI